MSGKKKLIRITTVPLSFNVLLKHQLRFMKDHYEVIAISSPGKMLEETKEREGVKTYAVEMKRAITPMADMKAIWQLYKIFKKEKPHIVHTHTPKAGLLGMLAGKLAGVPIRIHTVAGMPLMEAKGTTRKILNEAERFTYRCAHKVYPNAAGLRDFILEEKLGSERKIKVIGKGSSNGIDTAQFDPLLFADEQKSALRQSIGIAPDDVVFCFVGRMVTDKGINELVAAFRNIHSKHHHTKLLLVGPFENERDPLKPETEKIIHEHPAIKWMGYQEDVRPYFAISNVFAFPSYREGFPQVVMQAGAMGLPSIVSDINGCNEIIEDRKNGLIIPVKNTEALEAAMLKLTDDKLLREKLAGESRSVIVQNYEQEYVWNEILKEYKALEKELLQ